MKKFSLLLGTALLFGSAHSALAFGLSDAMDMASSASSQTSESSLLGSLTSQLGVSTTQAAGGAAALFNEASTNMNADDYSKLTEAVPDIKNITDTAAAASALSGGATTGSLIDQFSALGMDSSMIDKFTPIVLDYVKTKGGPAIMDMLGAAL